MSFPDHAINVIRAELDLAVPRLEERRVKARQWGSHADWPWNGFVLSYATLGGSANWDNKIGPAYDELYAWDVIAAIPDAERDARLGQIGNPRFKSRVSGWVRESHNRIAAAGGPSVVKQNYMSLQTANARIAFIRAFPGFGEKYGRNIPTDIYDELVREHFALDHRVKTILADCGYNKVSYKTGEQVLRQLAKTLETDAWTLDRVIYGSLHKIREQLALRQAISRCTTLT